MKNPLKIVEAFNKRLTTQENKLCEQIAEYVKAFCDKYQISFSSGMGTGTFHWNELRGMYSYPEFDFLKQLDPDLINCLNYDFGQSNASYHLGDIVLSEYDVPCDDFVYIRDDRDTLYLVELAVYDDITPENEEESAAIFSFCDATFTKMSRTLALAILANPNITMGGW